MSVKPPAAPTQAKQWHEVLLTCSDADEASALCHAAGASLIETIADDRVRAFVEGGPDSFLADLPDSLYVISVAAVENRNWHASCPELWAPKVIDRLTIVPIAESAAAPDHKPDEVLVIPGTGFGTGHHPATAMLIARLQHTTPAPSTVLDVGCGSGILAIVARKVWPSAAITAIDNDPLALENASDNCAINRVSDVLLICGTLADAPRAKYDLIVANLYSSLLTALQLEMHQRCERLIVSGVMESEHAALLTAFADWHLISSAIVEGWFSAEFHA